MLKYSYDCKFETGGYGRCYPRWIVYDSTMKRFDNHLGAPIASCGSEYEAKKYIIELRIKNAIHKAIRISKIRVSKEIL